MDNSLTILGLSDFSFVLFDIFVGVTATFDQIRFYRGVSGCIVVLCLQ